MKGNTPTLSREQESVASGPIGYTRLLAGPGTGKTRTLVWRVLYLVREMRVPPSDTIVLTFTRAAAKEFRGRLVGELGTHITSHPQVSTLHSFALKCLLAHDAALPLPVPIRLADDWEEKDVIHKDIIGLLGWDRKTDKSKVKEHFHQMESGWYCLGSQPDANLDRSGFTQAWLDHREIYGYTMRAELVYQLEQAMSVDGLVLRNTPRHLVVDEYQDLNPCDLSVISLLTKCGASLFAAGDDDQSIYGFRKAYPDGIRSFSTDYSPSIAETLSTCFRCDQAILDFASQIIAGDYQRERKALHCQADTGSGEVAILRYPNEADEAKHIAAMCRYMVHNLCVKPSRIMILLRSDHNNRFSKPILEAMASFDLPAASVANPLQIFDTPEDENKHKQWDGRRFLSYLRLCQNEKDDLAWRTLLKSPGNRLGDRAIDTIYEKARTSGSRFYVAMRATMKDEETPGWLRSPLEAKVEKTHDRVTRARDDMIGHDLKTFLRNLADTVIEDETSRKQVLAVLDQLVSRLAEDTIACLLAAFATGIDKQEQDTEQDAINIMTMHQAKGLQADVVFIVGAEDELIPGRDTGSARDDARRLLYVSATRARHRLYVTHCIKRKGNQRYSGTHHGSRRCSISRFLQGNTYLPGEPGSQYLARMVQERY